MSRRDQEIPSFRASGAQIALDLDVPDRDGYLTTRTLFLSRAEAASLIAELAGAMADAEVFKEPARKARETR